jgi:hypothetical protein
MPIKRAVVVGGLVACTACAGQDSGSTTITRDSAGVRIIESRASAWNEQTRWRIVEEPVLSIGSRDGSPDYQFVRIIGATRLDDGTIAVGDAGTSSIRFFDARGQLIRSVGRMGNGPGEFRAMQSLRRQGDSIDVFDRRMGRLTVFDRNGVVVRTLQAQRPVYAGMHRLTSGRWLAAEEEGFYGGRMREDATPGLHRFPSAAVVIDSIGAVVDTIGVFPGAETAYYTLDGQLGSLSAAFGRTLGFATNEGEAFVVTGHFLGFDAYDTNGNLHRSIRARHDAPPLQKEDVDRFNQALLDEINDSAVRDGFRRAFELMEVPPTKAPAGRVLVDPRGHAWLAAYENEYMPAAAWHVFARDGSYLGAVANVAGLRILEVGNQHVLGIVRDGDGVETLRLHELRRP